MQLTEQHLIKPNHPDYLIYDELAYKSKNLYNSALYHTRQHYFTTQKYQSWQEVNKHFIATDQQDYRALPGKISNQILKQVGQNFSSFFALLKKKNSNDYNETVRIPNYLPKDGRCVVEFNNQTISKKVIQLDNGLFKHTLCPRELNLKIISKQPKLDVVRIVPRNNHYVLECVYTIQDIPLKKDNGRYASIDLGLNNLATVFYTTGANSELWNGRPIKSINQYYNKKLARMKNELARNTKSNEGGEKRASKRITALHNKRNRKVKHELHVMSSRLVNRLAERDISLLIIGNNKQWKQDISLGRKTNQKFVSVPHSMFIAQLKYKCARAGIRVVVTEESYSSKASFLDRDLTPIYKKDNNENYSFSGKRVKRGLYRTNQNLRVSADVNGAGNILRKVVPDEKVFFEGIEAVVIQPVKITVDKSHKLS